MGVQRVIDRTNLKVLNNSSQFLPSGRGFSYFLIRPPHAEANCERKSRYSVTLNPIPSLTVQTLTPRSQQKMFSWEAEALQKKQNHMMVLKQENSQLRTEVDTLIMELSDIRDIMLKRRAFLGIVNITAISASSKRSASACGEPNDSDIPAASPVSEREHVELQLPALPPPAELP